MCVYWNAQSHEWLTLFLFCFVLFLHQGEESVLSAPQLSKISSFPWKIYPHNKKSWSFKNNCTWWWWWGHTYWKHPQSNAKFKNGVSATSYHQNKTHNFTTSLTYSIIIGLFFARLFLLLSSHTPLCFSLHCINNLCIDQQDPQSIYIYIYTYLYKTLNPKP